MLCSGRGWVGKYGLTVGGTGGPEVRCIGVGGVGDITVDKTVTASGTAVGKSLYLDPAAWTHETQAAWTSWPFQLRTEVPRDQVNL